jgi:hypothetical protein
VGDLPRARLRFMVLSVPAVSKVMEPEGRRHEDLLRIVFERIYQLSIQK